jgi:hypothetical protein
METQARSALQEIEIEFGTAEMEGWLEDRYATLEIKSRQKILTVEHLIPLEFAGQSKAHQLRGMANFYFSKYRSEKTASDLDRSLYYALLAAEKGERQFQYLNDLGFIYMELAEKNKRFPEEAITNFNESRAKNPAQQRCYYNLSVIFIQEAAEKRKARSLKEYSALLNQVNDLLVTALKHIKWEHRASPEISSLVHYNLSCCLCRIDEIQPAPLKNTRTHFLDEAIKHLRLASGFKPTRLQTVNDDFTEPEGDLCSLARNGFYTKPVEEARANFAKNWT